MSLFAQRLGTAEPVSLQRIQKSLRRNSPARCEIAHETRGCPTHGSRDHLHRVRRTGGPHPDRGARPVTGCRRDRRPRRGGRRQPDRLEDPQRRARVRPDRPGLAASARTPPASSPPSATDVDGFRVGDAVAFSARPAPTRRTSSSRSENAQPRPPQVSRRGGAALGIPVGTAYQALRSLGVGRRDTLLVHAGSGSVGQAAIQYARAVGRDGHRHVVRAPRSTGCASSARFPSPTARGSADRVRAAAPQGVTVDPRRRRHRRGDRRLARAGRTTATASRRSCAGGMPPAFGIRAFSRRQPHRP